MHIFMI